MMEMDKTSLEEVTYTPGPCAAGLKPLLIDLRRDFIASRELAWRLLVRNINAMYRQTYIGYAWAVLPPVITALVLIFLRSKGVIEVETTGYSYTLYVLTGVILWQTFLDSINSPLKMLNQSAPYLGKINFPRLALIMTGFGEVMFNVLIRCAVLLLVYVFAGAGVSVLTGVGLICLLTLIILGFAIGILLAPLGMLFKDVEKGLLAATAVWFFITPVFYLVPAGPVPAYVYLNPVAPLLMTVRELLMSIPLTQIWLFWVYTIISVIVLVPGLIAYKLSLPYIIERIEA
jgi:lipopolysaccharide transport system permease protein